MSYMLAYSACNSQIFSTLLLKGILESTLSKIGHLLYLPLQVQPKMVTTLSELQDR